MRYAITLFKEKTLRIFVIASTSTKRSPSQTLESGRSKKSEKF